jgi:uncharacterized protein DUF6399/winged helix-turn-helix DNA-binding protein
MRFWDNSRRIFNSLCDNATQSVRHLAQQTGLSKSSVHRLRRAMERRNGHPESWLWETEDGQRWLRRLVVATLYIFGLKRGVGAETMSEFFARLRLETQVGCSPSALRGVLQALEHTILETGQAWERDGVVGGEVREIIGAVDETFLERMMLVLSDLSTGYLVLEEVADDRTYATWKARVDERLAALRTGVLYLVSDRAQALIQLAEKGLQCLSMPDFFHLMHDIVKSYSLAIARQVRQAQQALKTAEDALASPPALAHADHDGAAAQARVVASRAAVQRWEEVRRAYRHHLETLSLSLHPFGLLNSIPQTSAQVESRLQAAVQAIETLAERSQLPARHDAMKKVHKQLPAMAALVDFWWEGVRRDLAHAAISPMWQRWAQEALLPQVYWKHHVAHTRCARRKAKMQQALEAVQVAFSHHALTQRLPPQALQAWQEWATHRVRVFQRTSSAVEGRNGFLAQLHHNQRGLPKHRYKVWTVLHNFDCRAADGTTPASRFFRRTFPDLFETVCSHIEALPRSRQRNGTGLLSG